MDGLKKLMAIFAIIVVIAAFTTPALAQSYGGGMARPQAGGGQQTMPQQGGLPESNKDLMATMEGMSDISMFTAAVKAAGYDQMLGQGQQGVSEQQGPIMVFAPTDKALQKDMGISDVNALVSDPGMAKSLVENCIVSNVKEPQQGSDTVTMTTIGGMQVTAKKSDTGITVNGVKVINAVLANNGMLAVTDGVVGMPGAR